MKINRLRLASLRNEEWFQLFTELKNLVDTYGAENLNIAVLYAAFLIQYNNADKALDLILKSVDTDKMEAADMKRDHTYRGLVDAVKSALNHFDPAKQKAAEEINVVVKHFGNLATKSGNEETAGLYNFTQMLGNEYAAQTSLLGLGDWVTELQSNNEAYEALVKDRNNETTSRTSLRMRAVRKDADEVYRQIVERLEALMTLNSLPTTEEFVNKWNGFLKRYADVIAMRGKKTKES
ncbi:MAG: DUF6261 family protein [Prevotellaceae bacterium]|jgi:hypothetical protein|nr:DUF6261 family protein [Prevotellaceae bacterium]